MDLIIIYKNKTYPKILLCPLIQTNDKLQINLIQITKNHINVVNRKNYLWLNAKNRMMLRVFQECMNNAKSRALDV